jgi:hypothetical protein
MLTVCPGETVPGFTISWPYPELAAAGAADASAQTDAAANITAAPVRPRGRATGRRTNNHALSVLSGAGALMAQRA